VPRPAAAQGFWTEASTIGYGGVGVGLGWIACGDCDSFVGVSFATR
jgi:hypothetical protein